MPFSGILSPSVIYGNIPYGIDHVRYGKVPYYSNTNQGPPISSIIRSWGSLHQVMIAHMLHDLLDHDPGHHYNGIHIKWSGCASLKTFSYLLSILSVFSLSH